MKLFVSELCGSEHLLFGKTLQTLARELVRRICFTTHITNDAPAAAASFANFMHCSAKAVARRHSAAHHGSAISAHDDAVIRPPRGGKIERARAHMRFQLSRPTHIGKAGRLRVDGPTSNKNGQATSGPAVPVQRGVHVDHQALPQTAFLPYGGLGIARLARISEEPNTMLRACPQANTTSSVNRLEAAPSPWRDSRRRRAGARPWSGQGSQTAGLRRPAQPATCPASSTPAGLFFPRLLRSL